MASAMAAKVFFIVISQKMPETAGTTDHTYFVLLFSAFAAGRTKTNSMARAIPNVITKTVEPVILKAPTKIRLRKITAAPIALILVDFFISPH